MSGENFLHYKPEVALPPYEELIERKEVLSPQTLYTYLVDAYWYLTMTDGIHQSFRQEYADGWIGWWIELLQKEYSFDELIYPKLSDQPTLLVPSMKIVNSYDDLNRHTASVHSQGLTSGLVMMGGGEGTPAHRSLIEWVFRHVHTPIMILERPPYLETKDRNERFLPLEMIVSMWHYHPMTRFIGISPVNNSGLATNTFYGDLHRNTGALYQFAAENDEYLWNKVNRGKYAEFCVAPEHHSPSTTLRTRQLMPLFR